MKILTFLWLGLVALELVSCTSNNQQKSKRLQGDVLISEFTKKLAETPKSPLHVYQSGWKTNYSTDIMGLLGLSKEVELEDAVKGGHEKIKALYASRKGVLKKEAEGLVRIQALAAERSKLVETLLNTLKKASNPEKRVSEFDAYLKGLSESDKKLLLLSLEAKKLKEKCKEGIEALKSTLNAFDLQDSLEELAYERLNSSAQMCKSKQKRSLTFYFTSYSAIVIYSVLGIMATIAVYYIYIKDYEEEVYV